MVGWGRHVILATHGHMVSVEMVNTLQVNHKNKREIYMSNMYVNASKQTSG